MTGRIFSYGALLQGALRTRETIEKFKRVPPQPGQTSPLLVYFGTLLTKGKLNAYESVELSQLVISQNKKHLLDAWFKVGPMQSPCQQEAGRLLRLMPGLWCGWAVHTTWAAEGEAREALECVV